MPDHIGGLTGGHDIAAAYSHLPAVKQQHVTPEQAYQDHLSDQYGIKAQNYNPGAMVLYSQDFAAHHGGGHDVIKQLTDLVASLRAEINEMKHGKSGAAHEPGHSKIADETKLANAKADTEKEQAKDDYDTYIAKKVAMKIAKKSADDILEMWG